MKSLRIGVIAALVALWPASLGWCADFPRWRGDKSNGSAGETAMPLVKSLQDVRVAWVSQALSPHPWNHSVVRGRTQWPRTVLANGGYCMPAVSDGKVYVSFYRPSGTVDKTEEDKWTKTGLRGYRLLHADQVIVCMDARTGRTLWEAVWPQSEANLIELYGGHNNICIADGHAYAIGNTGLLYCADAKTGQKKWVVPVGPSASNWAQYNGSYLRGKPGDGPVGKADAPDAPHPLGGSLNAETYNICPVVADGVIVTGEWSKGPCLMGFDARTGKHLWRQPKAASSLVPPLRWVWQGREYLVVAGSAIHCLDPRTGNVLWTAGEIGNTGCDAATPAIEGDLLVAHGPVRAQRDLPSEKKESWVCYRLSATGAQKVWSLDGRYPSGTYIAPVIHRGHVWLNFERDGVRDDEDDTAPAARSAIACVELASGKVISEVAGVTLSAVCPGPAAMGDLLVYQGGEYVWLMDISDPAKPKYWGTMPQPVGICCSASVADGLMYFRSAERLVACLDLRAPAARTAAGRHDDPAQARYELTLDGALRDGGTPRFYLHSGDGAFPQTWATSPPAHGHPDVLEPGTLKLAGGRIAGQVKALLGGTPYEYRLALNLKDGQVEGEYEDLYVGVPVKGDATGTMLALAQKNATLTLSWPRHWVGGQNQGHEHTMTAIVKDGKVTDVAIAPRLPHRPGISGTIERQNLVFDGKTLTGTVVANIKTDHIAISGRYTLELDYTVANNLLSGRVRSTRDGAATTTHTAWGGATVPASEKVSPSQAVFTIDLSKSIRYQNALSGAMDTRLWFTTDGGVVSGGTASARENANLQKADVSGLKVGTDRVKGTVRIAVVGDGYVLRSNMNNVYDIDVAIDGTNVNGSYEGTCDSRQPRKGKVTGTYLTQR
jgi:outer membrane protein assembly factor BamB